MLDTPMTAKNDKHTMSLLPQGPDWISGFVSPQGNLKSSGTIETAQILAHCDIRKIREKMSKRSASKGRPAAGSSALIPVWEYGL